MTRSPTALPSFRDQIALRYKWYGWIAGLGVIVFIFCAAWWHHLTFVSSLMSVSAGLSYFLFSNIYSHRQKMMDALDKDIRSPGSHFESYMAYRHHRWDKHAFTRLIIGTILGAVMLSLLLFSGGHASKWFTALFIIYILGVMIKSWMQFHEEIMLHDYRRMFRDQPTDISD